MESQFDFIKQLFIIMIRGKQTTGQIEVMGYGNVIDMKQ